MNSKQQANIQRAILLTLLFLVSGWGESWETIRQHAGSIQSIQADFTQEKHLKILARPLISKGSFIFRAPASLRWQYDSPINSILLLHNGKIRKFIRINGKISEQAGISMDGMQMVIQEISQWLNGRFTESPTFKADLKADGIIILTPRQEGLSRLINRIELKLDRQPGLVKSVTIFENADSYTVLTFSHPVLNKKIPDTVFTMP